MALRASSSRAGRRCGPRSPRASTRRRALVGDADLPGGVAQKAADDGRADGAGAAGDEDAVHRALEASDGGENPPRPGPDADRGPHAEGISITPCGSGRREARSPPTRRFVARRQLRELGFVTDRGVAQGGSPRGRLHRIHTGCVRRRAHGARYPARGWWPQFWLAGRQPP